MIQDKLTQAATIVLFFYLNLNLVFELLYALTYLVNSLPKI